MARYKNPLHNKTRFVLVRTKFSGNIGAALRAMANMGFKELALVAPRCIIDNETYAFAMEARRFIDRIRIYDTLEEAVYGYAITIGTTASPGPRKRNVLSLWDMPKMITPFIQDGHCALVFGPEDVGLNRWELKYCRWLITIPTSPGYRSCNLAQAVMLTAAELFRFYHAPEHRRLPNPRQFGALMNRVEQLLLTVGFLGTGDPFRMFSRLRRIAYRADLTHHEMKTMHGAIRQIENYITHIQTGGKLKQRNYVRIRKDSPK